jgi:hypothetical protein
MVSELRVSQGKKTVQIIVDFQLLNFIKLPIRAGCVQFLSEEGFMESKNFQNSELHTGQ